MPGDCSLIGLFLSDGFNTTIVEFDSSSSSAKIPLDFAGQGYIVLTNAVQGQELNDDK